MEPLHARSERGVLTLTLDTPGSDVNVLDLRAAAALADAIENVDASIEVIVLASTKPGSFVNGVGLMMAGAVKSASDVARLTEPVRRAYRAVRTAKVPTVAAIRGNCYGCGVELALQCSHRIAVEDGPTSFYMTEIADYLFVPCFGGTQDLPTLVGLDAAVRLLVHGDRWCAREAARGGLVDRSVPARGSDDAIAAFVRAVQRGEIPSRRATPRRDLVDVSRERASARRLPEAIRAPSEAAIDLLERGARGEGAYDAEIEVAGQTLVLGASKAAQGFFFVRQMAAARERIAARGPRTRTLVLAGLPRMVRTLRRTAPADVAIVEAPAPRFEADRLLLASSSGPGVDVVMSTTSVPPMRSGARPVAWAPLLGIGSAFVEIDEVGRSDVATQLAVVLRRAGFEPVRTRPSTDLVTLSLARAWLDPLARFATLGGASREAEATLRALGVTRSARTMALALGFEPAFAESEAGEASSSALAAALSASIVGCAVDLLARGEVVHPSELDVLARHVLDFPLAERSLCSFATTARARALLDRERDLAPLVSPVTLTHLEAHVRRGQDFYR